MVPEFQKRTDFLNSVLDLLPGVEFLEHRAGVEGEIKLNERRIVEEKLDNFIMDY